MLRLFDLSLQLNGFPLKAAQKELNQILGLNSTEYEAFLAAKKQEILQHHLTHNALYKKLLGNQKIEQWSDIPVMRKVHFQSPLSERLSEGFTPKNVYINKTSGSSGDPFVFAKDKFCHALIWANIMRRFDWYGIDFNHSWQARFYGMPLDFWANKQLRFKDFLSRRYRFNIFDFSDAAIERMLDKFGKTRFDYINGYTSSIVLLAKYLERKNLFISDICPSLKVCVVTSEMLFDRDRALLEERFQIPIINEYGSAELEIIALENPQGEWLVNAETLFVEILDDNDRVLPYGQEGKIVVTSLYNKAHPMIRYEVGDRGILDEKSTLQKPLLQKLTGRTNDIALLPSGKKAPGMTFYSITKRLFDDQGNVKEFVIVQTRINTFEIQYTSERELKEEEKKEISRVFDQFLEPGLVYEFIKKETIDRGKSGKLKQFRSLV